MKKTALLSILVVVVQVAVGAMAQAQQPANVPRIGYLSGGFPSSDASFSEVFRQGLRKLGYVEGQNIFIEYRYSERKPDRFPELAARTRAS